MKSMLKRILSNLRLANVIFCILLSISTLIFILPFALAGETVPVEMAVKGAMFNAESVFKEENNFKLYNIFTCTDLKGNPASYIITLDIGEENPPLDEILKEIDQKRKIKKELENLLDVKINTDEKIAELKEEIREIEAKIRHDGEFITVVTTAKTDKLPILKLYKSLPFQIVALDEIKHIAKQASSSDDPEFKGIIYSEPSDFWFIFSNNTKTIFVNITSSKIKTYEELLEIYRDDLLNGLGSSWELFYPDVDISSATTLAIYYRYISGVPNFQQNNYPGAMDCTPVAAANILAYWDTLYPNLIIPPNTEYQLIENELKPAMSWSPVYGVYFQNIEPGIEYVCNRISLQVLV